MAESADPQHLRVVVKMDLLGVELNVTRRAEIIRADGIDEEVIERVDAAQGEHTEEHIDDSLEQGIAGLQLF
ncbi:hypothetical protein D3C74_402140 [compost metagenome]